ncbi:MAG: methyltransferase family protein [Leptolyngbyaceae cyanobacterium]
MQTAKGEAGFQVTQLTAINVAKAVTILVLVALATIYGVQDPRQVIYLCLHISYCVWWMLEQWLFPQRGRQIFTEKVGLSTFVVVLLFVGVFYALPGYLAFTNPTPLSYGAIALALPLYIFGSLINTAADVHKMTAKDRGTGLVNDGIWRSVRHVNYLGDLMRYSSFSVVAGSAWAFVLPGIIALMYLQRIQSKEQSMASKYPDFAEYRENSTRLLPWIW